jgi:hypothetical protein
VRNISFKFSRMPRWYGARFLRADGPQRLSGAVRCQFVRKTRPPLSSPRSFGGSSRIADIEKILVQGAQGPRRLLVILQTGT